VSASGGAEVSLRVGFSSSSEVGSVLVDGSNGMSGRMEAGVDVAMAKM